MTAAHFIGGGKQSDRPEGDFYPTPPEVTQALLDALLEDSLLALGSPIWEPCCGDGAISEVLNIYGHDTINTDITARMDDMSVSNFFDEESMPPGCNTIITNPPYMPVIKGKKKGVEAFIEHAFFILEGCDKMALLLKTTALSGQARCKIMEAAGLHTLYQFRHRITLHKNGIVVNKGSGMVDFAWFYFEKGHRLPPIIKWISVDN